MSGSPSRGANAWVQCARSNADARLRLFCFPYAGGRAAVFRSWPDDLPPSIEVCPVQLPGRGNRLEEAPFTRVPVLAEAIAHALVPYLEKPFAFFGHCVGALISFEVARQLRRQHGISPAYLCVSACGAPQIPDPAPAIHELPEPTFLEQLRRRGRMTMRILEAPEMMDLLMPVLRADFEMYETYTYTSERPLDCPLSVFGGFEDHTVTRDRLEAWRTQTSASFRLHMLPGDHFFLHAVQPLMMQLLSRELNQLVNLAT